MMRDLDIYEGLSEAPSTPEESRPVEIRPSGADSQRDVPAWFGALWRRFPLPVRERYRPCAILGEGGMGVVIEAHDAQMERVVAIKGVRDPKGLTSAARARLKREARLHAKLTHPNVLPVFDSWSDDEGNPWYSMMRVRPAADGSVPTLGKLLRSLEARSVEDRRLSELLETFLQICRAVAHAHSEGILHRDLKPENVLLGPTGEALVADWGLAAEMGGGDDAEPDLSGSPPYAAPEQMGELGKPSSSPRSDVYGLGAILFEILSGRRFTRSATPPEMPRRIPRELADVVRRAVAREPGERFPDVGSLREAIEAYLAGGLVEGMSYTPAERLRKWVRRRPGLSAALLTGGLFSLMLAYGFWRQQQAERRDAALIRRQFETAQQNLASSHAGWAAVEEERGHPDESAAYAALAFRTALEAPAGWSLPDGPVYSIFMRNAPVSPLIWASQVGAGCSTFRFSRDGRKLSAVSDGKWYIFDFPDTRRFEVAELGLSGVLNTAIDPDLSRMAMTDDSEHVSLREWGRSAPVLRLGTGAPWAKTAFSPDGSVLATGSSTGVDLWDVASGALRASLPAHRGDVWSLAFDPTGRILVSTDRTSLMCVWDVRERRLLRELEVPSPAVLALAFSADGRTLAVAGASDDIALYAMPEVKPLSNLGENLPAQLAVAFSPDGRLLASAGDDFQVRLWDVATGKMLAALTGHTRWVWGVSFSPDGRILATTGQAGDIRLWDVETAAAPRPEPTHGDIVTSMAYDAGGSRLLTLAVDKTVRLWDTASSEPTLVSTPEPKAAAVGFGPDGAPLVLAVTERGVAVHGLTSGDRLELDAGGPATKMALGGRGTRLAVAREDGTIRIWLVASPEDPVELEGPPAPVTALAFSPEGELLAGGRGNGDVSFWNTSTGRLLVRAGGQERAIQCLAFSRDGRGLVSGDDNGALMYRQAPDWRARAFAAHHAPVFAAAFGPRGDVVASSSGEGMYVWRVPSGEKLPHLELTNWLVTRVAFSPDRNVLALGGRGAPRLWDIAAIAEPRARIARIESSSFFTFSDEIGRLVAKPPREAPPPRPAH